MIRNRLRFNLVALIAVGCGGHAANELQAQRLLSNPGVPAAFAMWKYAGYKLSRLAVCR